MAEQSKWKGLFCFLALFANKKRMNSFSSLCELELSRVSNTVPFLWEWGGGRWGDCEAPAFCFLQWFSQSGLTTTMRQVLDCCNDFTNLYSSTMILTLVTQPNRNKHVSYESCMHCQPGLINVLQTHCTNCLILLWAFSSYTVLNSKIQGSERLWGGEWHLGNTPAPAACLLSCLIHSLYHLIRRMWRCGGEALSPWDRKGGAVLHLLLPWPGSLLCLLAARVANIAPGW